MYPAQDAPMVKPAWREQQKKKKQTKGRSGQGEPFAPIAEEVAPAVALGHSQPSWSSWMRESSSPELFRYEKLICCDRV